MAPESTGPPAVRRPLGGGVALVAGLLLFGALFLWALFHFTDGRRAAPPPELRTESR
jgi:hypothetical protein